MKTIELNDELKDLARKLEIAETVEEAHREKACTPAEYAEAMISAKDAFKAFWRRVHELHSEVLPDDNWRLDTFKWIIELPSRSR